MCSCTPRLGHVCEASPLLFSDASPFRTLFPEFVTGIGADLVRWQTARTATTIYHETEPHHLQPYAEISQQAEDGREYFATALVSLFEAHEGMQSLIHGLQRSGLTWQIDTDVNTRAQFSEFGNLTNIEQTTFGPMGQ